MSAFSVGAITAGLSLDTSSFTGGMLQVEGISRLFPGMVSSFLGNPLLGLAQLAKESFAAIAQAILGVAHAADDAGEAAQRLGVDVQFLTTVGAVAKDAGSSMAGLSDALKFLNNNAADAAAGNETAMKAFRDAGMSALDAAGNIKPAQQLFYELSDALAALPTQAQRTQAAMNLMGRGGTELLATMQGGSAGIKQFAQDIAEMGGGVDTHLAALGDKFGQFETLAGAAWDGVKKTVATPFLEFVFDNFEELKQFLKDLSEIARDVLGPIMKVLAGTLKVIFDLLRPVIHGIAELFRALGMGGGEKSKGLDEAQKTIEAAAAMPAAKASQPTAQAQQQQSIQDIVQASISSRAQTASMENLIPNSQQMVSVATELRGAFVGMESILGRISLQMESLTGFVVQMTAALAPMLDVASVFGRAAGAMVGMHYPNSPMPSQVVAGMTNVNIHSVSVGPIDHNEASSRIAEKLRPQLSQKIRETESRMVASVNARHVADGL